MDKFPHKCEGAYWNYLWILNYNEKIVFSWKTVSKCKMRDSCMEVFQQWYLNVFPKYANFIIFIIIGVKSLNIKKTFQEDALVISWRSQLDKTHIAEEYVRYFSSGKLLEPWTAILNSTIHIKDALNHDNIRLQIMRRYTNLSFAEFSFEIKSKYFEFFPWIEVMFYFKARVK